MPIMFCYIDPFVMDQQVVKLTPGTTEVLFTGSLDNVCQFMSNEYHNGDYNKITLTGMLAESVAEKIRDYGKTLYDLNDIEIEVLK